MRIAYFLMISMFFCACNDVHQQLSLDKKKLIGKWVNSDDNTLSIKFTERYYFEFDNNKVSDSAKYILSYASCEDEKQKSGEAIEYLTILEDDGSISFCYSIGVLNDSNLSLVYLNGNGTTSFYYR